MIQHGGHGLRRKESPPAELISSSGPVRVKWLFPIFDENILRRNLISTAYHPTMDVMSSLKFMRASLRFYTFKLQCVEISVAIEAQDPPEKFVEASSHCNLLRLVMKT